MSLQPETEKIALVLDHSDGGREIIATGTKTCIGTNRLIGLLGGYHDRGQKGQFYTYLPIEIQD